MFQRGEGFAGYALHTEDLETDVGGMRRRGLLVGEPATGGRRREDGQELGWRMATLPEGMSPFFLEDVTPRELRVPSRPEATTHANGALGAAGLVVLVADLEKSKERYRASWLPCCSGAARDPTGCPCASAPGSRPACWIRGRPTVGRSSW